MKKVDFTDKREVKIYIAERSVEDENGCWVWQKSLDHKGYGQAYWDKKITKAHRLSYNAYHGGLGKFLNFSSSKVVMHSCDNPACVNPFHLTQGTQKDNMSDAAEKGRLSKYKGELSKASTLKNVQTSFAKRLYKSGAFEHQDLACIFGVKTHVVSDFLTRTYQ